MVSRQFFHSDVTVTPGILVRDVTYDVVTLENYPGISTHEQSTTISLFAHIYSLFSLLFVCFCILKEKQRFCSFYITERELVNQFCEWPDHKLFWFFCYSLNTDFDRLVNKHVVNVFVVYSYYCLGFGKLHYVIFTWENDVHSTKRGIILICGLLANNTVISRWWYWNRF